MKWHYPSALPGQTLASVPGVLRGCCAGTEHMECAASHGQIPLIQPACQRQKQVSEVELSAWVKYMYKYIFSIFNFIPPCEMKAKNVCAGLEQKGHLLQRISFCAMLPPTGPVADICKGCFVEVCHCHVDLWTCAYVGKHVPHVHLTGSFLILNW